MRKSHVRERVVAPHTKLSESKLTQSSFAALHEREALRCHFRAVGQARCKASGGRAIPRRQTSAPREHANLRFAQPSIEQRSHDLMLRAATMAGPKIDRVIGRHP